MFFISIAVGQIMYDFLFFGVKLPIKPICTRSRQRPRSATNQRARSACQQIRGHVPQQLVDVRVTSWPRILD
ncbi:hypothetical protein WS63_33365 [Burkholderia stagnalis]|nr:hypothetical protein WS63_33365 [Burkholderia stagnalis]